MPLPWLPDKLLTENKKLFYISYHSLILLDYYLTFPPSDFSSPLPFIIAEPDEVPEDVIGDIISDRLYTKKELLDYLELSREKCYKVIEGLTEDQLNERFIEEPGPAAMNYYVLEILRYNMRHVQHHTAQLNALLRQEINEAPGWVFQSEYGPI